jgi:hypothetical protein
MRVGHTVIHQVYPIALVQSFPYSTVTFFELINANAPELITFVIASVRCANHVSSGT